MGNQQSSSTSKARPRVFSVPANDSEVLDFSQTSTASEKILKDKLLSTDPSCKALAAVGSGGTGKTTILRALAVHPDIWARFGDGIWYIELGQDATLHGLVSQLNLIATKAFDQTYGLRFAKQVQNSSTRIHAVTDLVRRLTALNFLLILDDAWDSNSATYPLVKRFSTEVQHSDGSLKLLTATRLRNVARTPVHGDYVDVMPRTWDDDVSIGIICHYASVDTSTVETMPAESHHRFRRVLRTCGGLPLSLAVAGSSVRSLMDAIDDEREKHVAWAKYWESLKSNISKLGDTASMHHASLFDTINSSLSVLEVRQRNRRGLTFSVTLALESLCVMRKHAWIPEHILECLWNTTKYEVETLVELLANASVISRTLQNGTWGVRCHDLVLDYNEQMSLGNGRGPQYWHSRVLSSFIKSFGTEACSEPEGLPLPRFWEIPCREDMYLEENIIHHIVGSGDVILALRLCLDYRWMARLNSDDKKYAFQQSMTDLNTIVDAMRGFYTQAAASGQSEQETFRILAAHLEDILDAMEMAIHPCTSNRRECPFQLQGRLTDMTQENDWVSLCIRSIEEHAALYQPWVRAGPGVLLGPHVSFKRVLSVPFGASKLTLGFSNDELVVAGASNERTELTVMDRRTGRTTSHLSNILNASKGCQHVIGIAADRGSDEIVLCRKDVCIRVLPDRTVTQIETPFQDTNSGKISSMTYAPKKRVILCGSATGYICLFSFQHNKVISLWKAHDEKIVGLAASHDGKVVLSASSDGSVKRWDVNDVPLYCPSGAELLPPIDRTALSYLREEQNTRCIAVSRSGSRLACKRGWMVPAQSWGGLFIWEREEKHPFAVDGEIVHDIAFDHDENFAFCALGSKGIGILKFGRGTPTWVKHVDARFCYKAILVTEDDSELLALTSTAGREDKISILRLDRVATETDEKRPSGSRACLSNLQCFAVSQDGKTVVSSSNSPGLSFFEVQQSTMVQVHEPCGPSNPGVTSKVFCGDGNRLAVTNNRELVAYCERSTTDFAYHVSIYRSSGMELIAVISHENLLSAASRGLSLQQGCGPLHLQISSLYFSSDGNSFSALVIISSTEEPDMWVVTTWDSRSGRLCQTFRLQNSGCGVLGIQHAWHRVQPHAIRPFVCVEEPLHGWYTTSVLLCEGGFSKKIATLDIEPVLAAYCTPTCRLWYLQWDGGIDYHLKYIELVHEKLWSLSNRNFCLAVPTLPHLNRPDPVHTTKDNDVSRYAVFISHAGPDKYTIAIPLYCALEMKGIRCFVDRVELEPGDIAAEKMEAAMEISELAIFILSPEFAARRWTIRELRHFLKRVFDSCSSSAKRPIVIPVFYRLSIRECRLLDPCSQDRHRLDDGSNLFLKEGFFNPDRQREASTEAVKDAMKLITNITGVENDEFASNSTCDPLALEARTRLIERVVACVARRHAGLLPKR